MVVSTSLKGDDPYVQVKYIGVHNHPKPPPIRATVAAKEEFRNLVKSYPPQNQLLYQWVPSGAKHQKAPHEIHPCYANDDKMRSEWKKILKEDWPSTQAT